MISNAKVLLLWFRQPIWSIKINFQADNNNRALVISVVLHVY